MRDPEAPKSIQGELDRCVKCGMCLAECPTYRLEADENESPRGRLALIEGLVQGHLDGDGPLIAHLDHCLGCRRCERVCPSLVPYGHLIDQAREMLSEGNGARWAGLIQNRSLLRLGTRLAQAVPTAFSAPLGGIHRLHEMARALGTTGAAPTPGEYPAPSNKPRGRVGLFLGCASAAQQGGALQAALRLLHHARYSVNIPSGGTCCGALSQHSGDPAEAARLASENRDAFDDELDMVLSIASGCGIHIDSYQPALTMGHQDICRFLLECGGLSTADFSPLPNRVFLHTPCSVENVYRGSDWARGLLALIPDLELATAGEAGQCCGAAGDYMLRYPEIAARLRDPILDELRSDSELILLTSNVGCAMHLADGLRNRGSNVKVLHPVELLARQLIGGTGA
jgi:glycolate oxidase iron-sulfur subunit